MDRNGEWVYECDGKQFGKIVWCDMEGSYEADNVGATSEFFFLPRKTLSRRKRDLYRLQREVHVSPVFSRIIFFCGKGEKKLSLSKRSTRESCSFRNNGFCDKERKKSSRQS